MNKIQISTPVERYRAPVGRASLRLKQDINEPGLESYLVNCGMFRRRVNRNSTLPLATDSQNAFWARKTIEAVSKEEATP